MISHSSIAVFGSDRVCTAKGSLLFLLFIVVRLRYFWASSLWILSTSSWPGTGGTMYFSLAMVFSFYLLSIENPDFYLQCLVYPFIGICYCNLTSVGGPGFKFAQQGQVFWPFIWILVVLEIGSRCLI